VQQSGRAKCHIRQHSTTPSSDTASSDLLGVPDWMYLGGYELHVRCCFKAAGMWLLPAHCPFVRRPVRLVCLLHLAKAGVSLTTCFLLMLLTFYSWRLRRVCLQGQRGPSTPSQPWPSLWCNVPASTTCCTALLLLTTTCAPKFAVHAPSTQGS
jgi:hypothetical protein